MKRPPLPRPLRLLPATLAASDVSSPKLPPAASHTVAHAGVESVAPQQNSGSKPLPTELKDSADSVSLFCVYCGQSLEGGEAGRRRHQSGERHVRRVLTGIVKYIVPCLLPCLSWRFPSSIPFSLPIAESTLWIKQQLLQLREYSLSTSNDTDDMQALASSIDLDLIFYLNVARPKQLKGEWAIENAYSNLCALHQLLPLTFPLHCPFCDAKDAYTPKMRDTDTVFKQEVWISPESELSAFWKHLGSESHLSRVSKFWKEHNIRHPSQLTQLSSRQGSKTKSNVISGSDSILDKLPQDYFAESRFIMTQANLQRTMESWSRLARIVQEIEWDSLPLAPANPDSLPSSSIPTPSSQPPGLAPQAFAPFSSGSPSPFPFLPPPSHFLLPPPKELTLRESIKAMETPSKVADNQRIGARWAEAIKSYVATRLTSPSSTPHGLTQEGLTNPSTLLIALSRQERIRNPAATRDWFPSFGGVWHEASRAQHVKQYKKKKQ